MLYLFHLLNDHVVTCYLQILTSWSLKTYFGCMFQLLSRLLSLVITTMFSKYWLTYLLLSVGSIEYTCCKC